MAIAMMEKHPIGSQAFMPLDLSPFLVVVAAAGEIVGPDDLHAFITDGRQGINLARGTWHHPVIALDRETDFIVVDRGGPGDNLVEYNFDAEQTRQVGLAPR